MARPIIKVENLSVTYNPGEAAEFTVLKDINLEIYENEYVIFFGPSGSGKSTLLYVIAGLEVPSQGHVIFHDEDRNIHRDLSTLSERELVEFHRSFIGMIFQAFYLVPSLSAKGNILLPTILDSMAPAIREERVETMMERFGIAEFQDRVPAKLSGGQQQRVAIARSLMNDPGVILADEPVGNLDSINASIVVDMISDLNRKDNKTVIHVTHDPRHLALADRVFYMKDGMITRVVGNRPVKKPSKYTGTQRKSGVLGKLASMYPYALESQLKAKLIVNKIFLPYTYHEIERIERIIQRFIDKEISPVEMEKLFDVSEEHGGVNLHSSTAKKLAKEISEFAAEAELLSEADQKQLPLRGQAEQLLEYLCDEHDLKLQARNEARAIEALAYRLSGAIDFEEFRAVLDESYNDGGVGLHKKTAEKIANEVEMLVADRAS